MLTYDYDTPKYVPPYDARLDPKSTGYDPTYVPQDGHRITYAPFGQFIDSSGNIKDMKYDKDKLLSSLPYEYFPRAIKEVSKVATYGAKKYARGSWQTLSDKEIRYKDAMFRHWEEACINGFDSVDEESGLLHISHWLWNCMAIVEMEIRKQNA